MISPRTKSTSATLGRLCLETAGRWCRRSGSSVASLDGSTRPVSHSAGWQRRPCARPARGGCGRRPTPAHARCSISGHTLREIAADLAGAQRGRQPRVAVAQQQRPDSSRPRQAEHPRLRRGRDAVLPVEVAIADDGDVGNLANALHAAVRVAAAKVVAQKGEPLRAGGAEDTRAPARGRAGCRARPRSVPTRRDRRRPSWEMSVPRRRARVPDRCSSRQMRSALRRGATTT